MKFIIAAILVCSVSFVICQVPNNDPIDIEMQTCLDSQYSTKGMADCIISATEKWDKMLNKNYQELLVLLTAEQKSMLKIAQRQWIKYRDKEIEFSKQLYSDLEGTMWIPVSLETKLDLTKSKALAIKNYVSNLTIDQ